jgi:hypothetical protein
MHQNRRSNILSKVAGRMPQQPGRNLDYGQQVSDAHEGKMFRQSMWAIMNDAKELHGAIQDEDDLPQWCHYKAAEAAHHIHALRDYLIHKLEMGGSEGNEDQANYESE